ncbi:protein phosphatase 1 regulatory subunit, putative [Bodo saltans]|uniref:Protein phosphatase 1 regulatory subunit, putative n=1 Tax=Bodo saltans TaxID=75058 RepID=A0A0S4IT07_BODSA|nr:protein phosphatase 1 regulatory subunit, putative [Bodo saltans]|eukprot:CUF64088.1 protein phosphatase 1 regulatory subunit, putative [Bodo saltans]
MSHVDDDDIEDPLPSRPTQRSSDEQEVLHVNVKDEVIEINNVRLFSFDEVALNELQNCTSLSMRKNLIHVLTDFPEALQRQLVELDLFDNKIRKIDGFFAQFSSLTKLDLSYNQIKEISGLEPLAPTLTELYLVENRIKEISGLDSLVNLRVLELGGNRLREVGDGLKELVNLEELWLGKNKIAQLGSAFNTLKKLRRLSLQANRLTEVTQDVFPLDANPALKELYLSENGLQEISHVSKLSSIQLLDYSFNPIRVINGDEVNPSTMPILEEFWLTDGKVDSWDEVSKFCGFGETLRTVYLERNPIEQDKRYRDKVYLALPFLTQIDSWPIVNKGNVEADRAIHRR